MSQEPLNRPPNPDDPMFTQWIYQLWKRVADAGQILWSQLDFTGSNLTDLQTRNHNDLQSIQGGTSAQYYHLTSAEYTGTGTGVFVRTAEPTIEKPNVDRVDFSTVAALPAGVGQMTWNDGEGTVDLGLKGGNVTLNLGQEVLVLCHNGTGSAMSDGQVVYISGAQGQRPSITLAQADSETTSSKTIGVVTEPIADGDEGFVTTYGIVRGFDTSAFAEGDALWLSASVAGGITTIKPVAPDHAVFVGFCVRQHASSGQIYVHIQNGHELDELHDVLITTPSDGEVLTWEASSSLWKNKPASGGGGGAALLNIISTPTTIAADNSYPVVSYLQLDANLIVNGNVMVI